MITEKDSLRMRSTVVGHWAGEKRNFWVPFLAVIVVVLAVLWIISLEPKEEKKTLTKEKTIPAPLEITEVKLLEKAICRSLKNHLPEVISDQFSPGEKVYYYTKIMLKEVPQKIEHLWLDPQGKEYVTIELDIIHQPANTWSRITLPPKSSGTWLVKTLLDGKAIDESIFRVK